MSPTDALAKVVDLFQTTMWLPDPGAITEWHLISWGTDTKSPSKPLLNEPNDFGGFYL
jgi:hypothetical protein